MILETTATITSSREIPGVRAGSALLALGERLLVVGDDAYVVTWVDPTTGAVEAHVLAGDGAPLPKPAKPDLEAAARHGSGSVWILGSGSLPNRRAVFELSPAGDLAAHDGEPLHALLAGELDELPNIEGAVFDGDTLRLFHRATGSRADVLLDVTGLPHEPRLTGRRELEPPLVGGVPAHVTDVTLAADGRIALLAAAEDTVDAVLDGPVAGTLFGYLGEGWTPILEPDGRPSVRKAEGLVLDADCRGGWLVTDRDDPDLPAELCRFTLA